MRSQTGPMRSSGSEGQQGRISSCAPKKATSSSPLGHHQQGDQALAGSIMAAAAARAALNTAVEKHGIDPGTPEEQGAALAQRGLWAETWDQGDSWHYSGDPEQPLSPEEAVVECAAMEANEAENYADFGTSKPDSEAAAQASFNRAVTIEWVVSWTTEHNLWEWTTADVVSKKIKPMTAATRCRFEDLPEVRASGAVGPADSFASHCWTAKWGLLVSALADHADPKRRVWLDVLAVRQ